jgi:hypothetical protein
MSEFVTRRNFSATPKNYFGIKKYEHPVYKKETVSFVTGKDANAIAYDILCGYVVDLITNESEYQGEKIYNLNIHLASPDGSSIDVINTSRYGGFVRDFLLKLLSLEQISYVELAPFLWSPESSPDRKFIGCSVRHNDRYLPELPTSMKLKNGNKDYLPKVTKLLDAKGNPVMVKGKEILNSEERDKAIDNLIQLIKTRLVWSANSLKNAYIGNEPSNYLPADSSQYEEVVEEEFDDAVPF